MLELSFILLLGVVFDFALRQCFLQLSHARLRYFGVFQVNEFKLFELGNILKACIRYLSLVQRKKAELLELGYLFKARVCYIGAFQVKPFELSELGYFLEACIRYFFGAIQDKPRHLLQVRLGELTFGLFKFFTNRLLNNWIYFGHGRHSTPPTTPAQGLKLGRVYFSVSMHDEYPIHASFLR